MARVLPIILSFALVSAGPKKSASDLADEINQALKPFRAAAGVTLGIKKKTVSQLLGREKISKGTLSYRKGKVRIEMESPEASLLIMDGKTIWLETQLDKEFGGTVQVSKTKMGPIKKSNTLLASIFDNQRLTKEYKLVERKEIGEELRLSLEPRKPEGTEIQQLVLWLSSGDRRLKKLVYVDDRENEVTLELEKPKRLEGDLKKIFNYSPPEGAEVTEF